MQKPWFGEHRTVGLVRWGVNSQEYGHRHIDQFWPVLTSSDQLISHHRSRIPHESSARTCITSASPVQRCPPPRGAEGHGGCVDCHDMLQRSCRFCTSAWCGSGDWCSVPNEKLCFWYFWDNLRGLVQVKVFRRADVGFSIMLSFGFHGIRLLIHQLLLSNGLHLITSH